MANDLKTQLIRACQQIELLPYSTLSIEDSHLKFCKELADQKIRDCKGEIVCIYERNFPKFLGMKLRNRTTGELLLDQNGREIKAKSSVVLKNLHDGTFNPNEYQIEYSRLRTMFWIPDVIMNADAIHPNVHPKIEGDRVYLKGYVKKGSEVKLVFTNWDRNERIVITSFLVKRSQLESYIGFPSLWP